MRAPFQVLVIPYRWEGDSLRYCVFHRSDWDQWQFVSGGGEDEETPQEAAKREAWEEACIQSSQWTALKSLCSIPAEAFSEECRRHWERGTYVVPEYAFGVACQEDITLSPEHTECVWLPYDEATKKLTWDSNRTALYELDCRMKELAGI
ncbi:MAG: NUDIX hydrolase [Acutalibacter sp.]|nr:nUDIX hydrolase [Firmicutes bacterium CAG:94]